MDGEVQDMVATPWSLGDDTDTVGEDSASDGVSADDADADADDEDVFVPGETPSVGVE